MYINNQENLHILTNSLYNSPIFRLSQRKSGIGVKIVIFLYLPLTFRLRKILLQMRNPE